MEFIKKTFRKIKENKQKKQEIQSIQHEAYINAMKEEAIKMGENQAKIEAEHREIEYRKKLKAIRDKREVPQTQPDLFGLKKHNENTQTQQEVDWLGRSYIR